MFTQQISALLGAKPQTTSESVGGAGDGGVGVCEVSEPNVGT